MIKFAFLRSTADTVIMSLLVLTMLVPAIFVPAIFVPAILIPNVSFAQSDPAAKAQRELENTQRLERQQRLREGLKQEDKILDVAPPRDQQLPVDKSVQFKLTAIIFSPSEWLSKRELAIIAQRHQGKTIGFADLQAVINDVNRLYRSKEVITAQAMLPPQKIENGIVHIKLVEGKLGKKIVKNNNSTRKKYILDRVPLKTAAVLDTKTLEQALMRFNRIEDIRLRAQLQKGESFGLTDVVLNVAEPNQHNFELFGSNAGTDETGVNRFGVSYINNSVSGNRDRFGVSYLAASRDSGGAISYDWPINLNGSRVTLSYAFNDLQLRNPAFSNLDIAAESRSKILQLNHPIAVTDAGQFSLVMAFQDRESFTEIDDFTVQRSHVYGIPLDLRWESFTAKSAFSSSFVIFNGKEREFDPRSFNRFTFSSSYMYQFEEALSLVFNVSAQTTSDNNIPSGNKFQVGGMSSVRGYDEGLISGDKGAFLNIEVHKGLDVLSNDTLKVSAVVFHDRGYASPKDSAERYLDNHLGSVGVGININNGNIFSASLLVGFPTLSDDYNQNGHALHLNFVFRPPLD